MKQTTAEPASARGGFSLVEIIAAIMILSTGLLAMAASMTFVSAQLRSTAFDTQRVLARQQVIEQLRGTFFANLTTSSAGVNVGRYNVRWVVTTPAGVGAVRRVAVITTGPAYRAGKGARVQVADTATIEIVSPR
jgi:prepilin-type N-terminal cleavage/methylation domain-containing protein